MNRGILFAVLVTLVWSGLFVSCRNAADPKLLRTVDSLHSTMNIAYGRINDLDQHLYVVADSLYQARKNYFNTTLADTLDRKTADTVANQYLVLRETDRLANDHKTVQFELSATQQRLTDLRNDLVVEALDPKAALTAVSNERLRAKQMDKNIVTVIENFSALEFRVNELLTDKPLAKK